MTVSHNAKTGTSTIRLTWLETRQFLSSPAVRETVSADLRRVVSMTSQDQTEPTDRRKQTQ